MATVLICPARISNCSDMISAGPRNSEMRCEPLGSAICSGWRPESQLRHDELVVKAQIEWRSARNGMHEADSAAVDSACGRIGYREQPGII